MLLTGISLSGLTGASHLKAVALPQPAIPAQPAYSWHFRWWLWQTSVLLNPSLHANFCSSCGLYKLWKQHSALPSVRVNITLARSMHELQGGGVGRFCWVSCLICRNISWATLSSCLGDTFTSWCGYFWFVCYFFCLVIFISRFTFTKSFTEPGFQAARVEKLVSARLSPFLAFPTPSFSLLGLSPLDSISR